MKTNMTHIKAVFAGTTSNLEFALFRSIRFASFKRFFGNELHVTWIHETSSYEAALEATMDCISIDTLGPVEIVRIG